MVIDTLGNVESGKIPVRVINIGDEDVWLKPKSRIGTLHKVEIVKSTDDEYDIDIHEKNVYIHKINIESPSTTAIENQNKDLNFN